MKTPPRRTRERRTQEQRSLETRSKVVQAAKECVAELGFQGATMTAIAERAGVTWGAMQHQFGDKNSILDTVLESCLAEVETACHSLADAESDPRRRLKVFVKRFAGLLRGPSYAAFLEIQLARSRNGDAANDSWAAFAAAALERSWFDVFGDLDLAPRKLRAAQRFFFVVASGIAAESLLFPRISFTGDHLEALEDTLRRLLELGD